MKLEQTEPATPFTLLIDNLFQWKYLGFRHPDFKILFNKECKQKVPDQTASLGAVRSGTILFAHAFTV